MVKVNLFGRMGVFMRETGKKTNSLDKVSIQTKIELKRKVSGWMVKEIDGLVNDYSLI